jgi:hypothetical protein
MKNRPRLVVLPTVMKKRGWVTPAELREAFKKYRKYMNDELLRAGIFVHSIAYGGPDMIRDSLSIASSLRGPLGIHLSEGVSEKRDFLEYTCCLRENVRIVAIHCLNDNYRDLGLRCSACPGSNILLYGKTLLDTGRITSFGSDWPHLIGTVGGLLPLLSLLYESRIEEVFYKATIGGYNDYGISSRGDLVAYDGSINSILRGEARPRLVAVDWKPVVIESRLTDTGESIEDVERDTLDAIMYAVDVYGNGETPYIPSKENLLAIASSLFRSRKIGRLLK